MTRRRKRTSKFILASLLTLVGLLVFGPDWVRLVRGDVQRDRWVQKWRHSYKLSAEAAHPSTPAERTAAVSPAALILLGARMRARKAARYDPSYRAIDYPMGDVPDDRGACTDVVVRSLRAAGVDLQQLMHEDMLQKFSAYPNLWGLRAPDPSIDHRRAANQMCYLGRYWQTLGTHTHPDRPDEWQPGDLVYWRVVGGRLHCGVVSDRIGPSGLPMVIHNLSGCREDDCLARWRVVAHFRYPDATYPGEHRSEAAP